MVKNIYQGSIFLLNNEIIKLNTLKRDNPTTYLVYKGKKCLNPIKDNFDEEAWCKRKGRDVEKYITPKISAPARKLMKNNDSELRFIPVDNTDIKYKTNEAVFGLKGVKASVAKHVPHCGKRIQIKFSAYTEAQFKEKKSILLDILLSRNLITKIDKNDNAGKDPEKEKVEYFVCNPDSYDVKDDIMKLV